MRRKDLRLCYSDCMRDQIWLIGFMATGKTRVLRPLAAALDWEAVDIDDEIERRAGGRVRDIFERDGEAAFRAIESKAIEDVAGRSNVVVATGGGSVLAEANRQAMRRRGFLVCLEARPETIAARITNDSRHISERPLLQGGEPLQRIIALKQARQPLYADADFIIQTDDMTPDQVTHQILTAYREQAVVSAGGA